MGDLQPNFWERMSIVQKRALMCIISFVLLMSIIVFAVCMANYKHLGPDDQVILKRASGKYEIRGPQSVQLNPFHSKEWRKALVLDPLNYAIVVDEQTALMRILEGPKMYFLKPHEKVKSKELKIVLEKTEYIRLTDKLTGVEEVIKGPQTVVPTVTQVHNGPETAVFLNVGQAVIRRSKMTGVQELVTSCSYNSGLFFPEKMEEIVAIRPLVHVLAHEALVVRDVNGKTTVFSGQDKSITNVDTACEATKAGGTSFFLHPHSKIVRMKWSTYPNPRAESQGNNHLPSDGGSDGEGSSNAPTSPPATAATTTKTVAADDSTNDSTDESTDDVRRLTEDTVINVSQDGRRRLESIYVDVDSSSQNQGTKKTITAIDLRTHKSFYEYEVRTNDNVRMALEGTLSWHITDVSMMLQMTSDPEGDIWSKTRSILIGAISEQTFEDFMKKFNDIVQAAFKKERGSTFFTDRGLDVISIELNNFSPIDDFTKKTLQSIIRTTVKQINDLKKQKGEADVQKTKIMAEIALETDRSKLIDVRAQNQKIDAETQGAKEGEKKAERVLAFLNNLKTEVADPTERLDLYKQHKKLEGAQKVTQQLTQGEAKLYMAPKETELLLQMPHHAEF